MLVIFLFFIILFLLPSPTKAANYNLSISPPVLEIITKPNKSFIQTFTLKNQGPTITLIPQIVQLKPIDNQGHVTIPNLQPVTNLPLHFSLENSNLNLNQPFTLPTNQSQQLVLRIASASTNQTQDFYLALALVPQTKTTNQPLSQPIITSLLFITLTPDGHLPINLQLKNFNPPAIHDSTTPLKLQPQLLNTTSTMIRPKTNLTIKNWRGKTLLDTNLASDLILGHQTRLLTFPNHQPLIWKPPKFAIGPYQITLTVTSQANTNLIQETKTVFLFPLQYTVYFLLFLFLIIILKLKPHQKNLTS